MQGHTLTIDFYIRCYLIRPPKEGRKMMDPSESPTLEKNVLGAACLNTSQKGRYPFTNVDRSHDDPFIIIHAKPTATLLSTRRAQQIQGGCSSQKNIFAKVVSRFKVETTEETAARLVQEEALTIKYEKNQLRKTFHLYVLLNVLMQDQPRMVKRSVEYLTNLVEQSQLQSSARKDLNKEQIEKYLTIPMYKYNYIPFIKQLSQLLDNHLVKISQNVKSFLNLTQTNANVQIISLLLKYILEFQEYIPPKDYSQNSNSWHIKLQMFYTLFDIHKRQFQLLKKLFLQNYSRITYLSQVPHLNDFVLTYYLFHLKKRLSLSKIGKFQNYQLFMAEFRARKHDAMQKRMSQMKGEEVTLSQLFAQKRPKMNSMNLMSRDVLIQSLQIFQEIEKTNTTDKPQKHTLINYLSNKHKLNVYQLRQKFKRHICRMNQLREKYGNDLNELKDALIMKQIAKNPDCNYEEVFNNTYNISHLYIKQDYFEDNVHRLLAKETHYQQLRYLKRVLIGADLRKGKTTVLFTDCCSLTNRQDSKVVIAVTLAGKFFCRKFRGNMYIIEDIQYFLKGSKPSIVILFDDQFPQDQYIQYPGLFHFRKTHTLLLLPRVSLAPSPCAAIANSLKAAFRGELNEPYDQEEVLQAVLQEFEPRVKEIVEKEWEKVQQLFDPNVHPLRQENGVIIKMEEDQESESSPEVCYGKIQYVKEEEDERSEENQKQEGPPSTHFTRSQGKEGIDANSSHMLPVHRIIENLRARSANDLRLALARLLQLNAKTLFKFHQAQRT